MRQAGDGFGDVCDADDGLWLLSIHNHTHELHKVDVATGKGTPVCTLDTRNSYPSLTFGRLGGLYAANNGADRLDRIDPCTHEVVGITADLGFNLFGGRQAHRPRHQRRGAHDHRLAGARLWRQRRHLVRHRPAPLRHQRRGHPPRRRAPPSSSRHSPRVGIELHPGHDVIYACSRGINRRLYRGDKVSGATTFMGVISDAKGNNLAAPDSPLSCPDWSSRAGSRGR
ncbi:MAG: hypothetical protein QF464_00500 [Myxococcota bacterium]|nr:hypothetical protein [Myxococcota bacterium]